MSARPVRNPLACPKQGNGLEDHSNRVAKLGRGHRKGANSLHCFGLQDPGSRLEVVSVRKCECRDPQKLLARQLKKSLDHDKLEQLPDHESRDGVEKIACRGQIGRNKIDRLKKDHRNRKQSKAGIRGWFGATPSRWELPHNNRRTAAWPAAPARA
jgi:hypothetical protein